jgi:hypothetical protein
MALCVQMRCSFASAYVGKPASIRPRSNFPYARGFGIESDSLGRMAHREGA